MNMKIKWLREKLNSLGIDGMIVSNPVNIQYLTNIEAEGTLLITRKENIYITDGRYLEAVHNKITIDDEIVTYESKDLSPEDYEHFFWYCSKVGFEEKYVTYYAYQKIMPLYKINTLVETDNIIEKQRMVKDKEEIEKIEKACKITDNCFTYLTKFIKKGMTEKEIALEIERYFKLNGADGTSFDPIVASGPNSSMPHAVPTDRAIKSGDVILLDFGCKYEGYCSDMTRTIFMTKVPNEIKAIYDLVLKNQEIVLKDIKDGISIKSISKAVDNSFELQNHMMAHGLGHGVGLEIHEMPSLNSKNDTLFKENMIVTDEPGIYIPGQFGVRIEDTVLVTKNGSINLTKSDKNYIII